MEIIQVKSGHSLVTSIMGSRPVEEHSYKVNCRQFVSHYEKWQRSSNRTPTQGCDVMTLDYIRIWITEQEGKQIADAIKTSTSPVVLE